MSLSFEFLNCMCHAVIAQIYNAKILLITHSNTLEVSEKIRYNMESIILYFPCCIVHTGLSDIVYKYLLHFGE